MARDRVEVANSNYRVAFEKTALDGPEGDVARFGPITATASGIRTPAFNRLFVFEEPSREQLADAIEWMTDYELPFWVTVPEGVAEETEGLEAELGVPEPEQTDPGMILDPLEEIPEPVSVTDCDTDIDVVSDSTGVGAFREVFAEVYGRPLDEVRDLFTETVVTDEEIESFVGRVDGQPVACGQLVRNNGIAGVYSIGIIEEYRRRGIGEAMTWKTLRVGRESGCRTGILQSSEMGYGLYENMGFETVVNYLQYEPDFEPERDGETD